MCHVPTETQLRVPDSPGESNGRMSVSSQNEEEPLTFSRLSSYVSSIRLPGAAWATQVVDGFGVEAVVFSEVALAKKRDQAPFMRKTLDVTVASNGVLSLRAFIHDRPITPNAISGDVASCGLRDLESVIHNFNNLRVCAGGPDAEMYHNIQPECAYIDACGVWRHKNCMLFTEVGSCQRCERLNDTLRIHNSRMQKRGEKKRIRLLSSPSKKSRIDLLRKARIACYRSKVRLLKGKKSWRRNWANAKPSLSK